MLKTVELCRKHPIPYPNTLNRTIPYINTLSRNIPYLNNIEPYLNTWQPIKFESSANQNPALSHAKALGWGGRPLSALGSSRLTIVYLNTCVLPQPLPTWSAHFSTT